MNIPWAVWVLQFKMAVRLQPCPLSRGPGKANALSAGRSIQCWMRDAAQVQSGGATVEACAMVMGIEVPVRVRCAVVGCVRARVAGSVRTERLEMKPATVGSGRAAAG